MRSPPPSQQENLSKHPQKLNLSETVVFTVFASGFVDGSLQRGRRETREPDGSVSWESGALPCCPGRRRPPPASLTCPTIAHRRPCLCPCLLHTHPHLPHPAQRISASHTLTRALTLMLTRVHTHIGRGTHTYVHLHGLTHMHMHSHSYTHTH